MTDQSDRSSFLELLADPDVAVVARTADTVVRDAVDRLTTADVAVLVALPTHWHRIAVGGALRPWPAHAVDAVGAAGAGLGWADADTAALCRVMADTDPELTRPEGLDDPRRWWIVAGSPWDWTVWRADDGTLALEVLRSGWSGTCATAVLDREQEAALTEHGIDALAPLVASLRDG